MQLLKSTILIISPEPWGECFVSKHHYAVTLAQRGNSVYFLNPPGSSSKIRISKDKNHNVNILDYPGHFTGLRFLPSPLARLLDKRVKVQLEEACSCEFDVIWSFDNSRFFNLDVFGDNTIKICHIVDFNQDFQTSRHASTADICLTTSDYISGKLKKFNNNTFNIGHGYNHIDWEPSNKKLPGHNKFKALYVGNLLYPTIDYMNLINTVAVLPNVDFCFIGPHHKSNLGAHLGLTQYLEKLKKFPNVYFLGPKPANELPCWLDKADVLFFVYKESERKQMANPHKMMEYLGSGKPIVCSYTEEYKDVDPDLILMAETNYLMPKLFKKVISDLSFYSSENLALKRKAIALTNSYENQIKKIEDLL